MDKPRPEMFNCLLAKLPNDLIIEIALFEGRILRAYLRDYVAQVYSRVYKNYFGYRFTLKIICGGSVGNDRMAALPFYTAWSTMIRLRHPEFVKQRKPRSHMRPYVGIVPETRLIEQRLKIEKSLDHFFAKTEKPRCKTETSRFRNIYMGPYLNRD